MIRVALALYLAHLLTDFVFQTSRMVKLKRVGRFAGYRLHGVVHYTAAVVLCGFFVPGMLFSLRFQLAVVLLTVFLAGWWIVRAPPAAEMVRVLGILRRPDNKILLLLVVYVAVIFGAGWLIRFLTKPLMRDLKLDESHAQLGNAGMFIGWLERFLFLWAFFEHYRAAAGLFWGP